LSRKRQQKLATEKYSLPTYAWGLMLVQIMAPPPKLQLLLGTKTNNPSPSSTVIATVALSFSFPEFRIVPHRHEA